MVAIVWHRPQSIILLKVPLFLREILSRLVGQGYIDPQMKFCRHMHSLIGVHMSIVIQPPLHKVQYNLWCGNVCIFICKSISARWITHSPQGEKSSSLKPVDVKLGKKTLLCENAYIRGLYTLHRNTKFQSYICCFSRKNDALCWRAESFFPGVKYIILNKPVCLIPTVYSSTSLQREK